MARRGVLLADRARISGESGVGCCQCPTVNGERGKSGAAAPGGGYDTSPQVGRCRAPVGALGEPSRNQGLRETAALWSNCQERRGKKPTSFLMGGRRDSRHSQGEGLRQTKTRVKKQQNRVRRFSLMLVIRVCLPSRLQTRSPAPRAMSEVWQAG